MDHEFVDPITLEILFDPVLASDGFFYERVPLLVWIRRNQEQNESTTVRSPTTNKLMEETILRSRWFNEKLKRYREEQGLSVYTPERYGVLDPDDFYIGTWEEQAKEIVDDILDDYEDGDVSPYLINRLKSMYNNLPDDEKKHFLQYVISEDIEDIFIALVPSEDYHKYINFLINNRCNDTLEYLSQSTLLSRKYVNKIRRYFSGGN